MMKLQLLSSLSPVIFVLITMLAIPLSSSYQPKYHYKIRCGAPTDDGSWTSDGNHKFSPFAATSTNNNVTPVGSVPGIPLASPYDHARIFWGPITYTFNLSSPGPILLRLYFSPNTAYKDIDPSVFYTSVTANDEVKLLVNFSAKASAQESGTGFEREFYLTHLDHRLLNLTFSPNNNEKVGYGFINGIEILSLPNDLYLHTPKDQLNNGVPYLVDGPTSNRFNYSTTFSMETMFRWNVGGAYIEPDQDDTGLFRTWLDDTNFLGVVKGTIPALAKSDMKINYTEATPSYTAPEQVYLTRRILGNVVDDNTKQRLKLNLAWTFEVDGGFNYSLRLHFRETDPTIIMRYQKVFDIYVNNQMASPEFDIFKEQGDALGVPIYRDYVTYVDGVGTRVNLSLQLVPSYSINPMIKDVLLNGLEVFKLSNSSNSLAAPNPILPFNLSPNQNNPTVKSKNSKHLLPIVIGGLFVVMGLGLLLILLCCCKRKWPQMDQLFDAQMARANQDVETFLKTYGDTTPKRYTYMNLKRITNSFKDKLGEGGYGFVYKGNLSNGQVVAVKLLKKSREDAKEFINEVASIGKTNHRNIVKLLGFCFEGRKRALVYEFMPNGSLDKFVYGKENNQSLSWEQLFDITIGIARGLEYLHRGCSTRILHFDIKPHNILLDENFNPRISDFGLAKSSTLKESIISMSEARGTVGYIAPEVFLRNFGGVSNKSDVYSYGMLVLEMVGCRKKIGDIEVGSGSEHYFPNYVYKQLETWDESNDQDTLSNKEERELHKKMIVVSLWCVQTNPGNRPTMTKVVEMLEGSTKSLPNPPTITPSSSLRLGLNGSTTMSSLQSIIEI